jgi:hypothetical protein
MLGACEGVTFARAGDVTTALTSATYFGHVEQIASNEAAQTILVQCPRCRSRYEFAPRGSDAATRLTVEQATERFPR